MQTKYNFDKTFAIYVDFAIIVFAERVSVW